ncbi:MAG: lipocalin family protein [Candidatus Nitrosoglobus sp.]
MKYRSMLNIAFLFFASISTVVYAQPIIKDRSDIVGAWALEMTAQKKDGSNSNKEASTWDFRPDGTVVISGYNKFLKQDTTFEKTYEIADNSVIEVKDDSGTIKYPVIEKTDDEMIVKGPYGYHFFKRK